MITVSYFATMLQLIITKQLSENWCASVNVTTRENDGGSAVSMYFVEIFHGTVSHGPFYPKIISFSDV